MNEETTTQTIETTPAIEQELQKKHIIAARVFLVDDRKTGVYLNERCSRARLDPLCWQAPGGKVEEGEHPLIAVARELKEEAGLDLPLEAFVPFDVSVFEHVDGTVVQTYYFIARLPKRAVLTNPEPEKAGDFVLMRWSYLGALALIRGMAEPIQKLRWKFNATGAMLSFVEEVGRELRKRLPADKGADAGKRGAFGRRARPIPGTPRMAIRRKNPFKGCLGFNKRLGNHITPVVLVPESIASRLRRPTFATETVAAN